MNFVSRRRSYIIIQFTLILAIFAAASIMVTLVIRQDEIHYVIEQHEQVSSHNTVLQTKISNEINESLNLVLGLIGFINAIPEPTQEQFETIARVILDESDIIKNIGLAPDNVISYMYPLKGNEAALGLDYMKLPAQKDAVLKAIEKRKVVIAGPVNLVQGGEGLIARIPIFINQESSAYWGIASIVVDKNKLFSKINIDGESARLGIAVKGKDGAGMAGDMVYGDPAVFDNSPVLTRVDLPDGYWVIAASPISGWTGGKRFIDYPVFWIVFLIASVISILVYSLLASHRKMSFQALYDPLTKIANRRLCQLYAEKALSITERNNSKLYVIYFDLDNFKNINDAYGHKTGDAVLQKAAEKISGSIRNHDIFARMGGDEFVLMPMQVFDRDNINQLCDKIIRCINELTGEMKLSIQLGCSIGAACYPEDGTTIEELIKNADKAMYSSKLNGKNRTSFFS